MATNPRAALQSLYGNNKLTPAQEKAKAAEDKRISDTLGGVTTIGKGAMTFANIDKYLADNPDAQYFRIENTINAPSGGLKNGMMNAAVSKAAKQGIASIVGQDSDAKAKKGKERYANVTANGGDGAVVGLKYTPSSFFKDNSIEYNSDYGMIYSREEYGKLKEDAASKGKSDRFLEAAVKKPEYNSTKLKDKGFILTGEDAPTAKLSTTEDDDLNSEDAATSKRILG